MGEKICTDSHGEAISCLRKEVERAFGVPARTPKQFEALRASILDRTGVLLSATTLKRLWNYIDEKVEPRRFTLDVLADYAGWHDFDSLLSGVRPDIESGIVRSVHINVGSDLLRGDRIRLMWQPGRVCEVEYLGDARFVILSSEGTRLKAGDTFSCSLIVSREPLFLDSLCHDGRDDGVYVCGRKSGIIFVFPSETEE